MFSLLYVCASCVCKVAEEVRRRHQVSVVTVVSHHMGAEDWTWDLWKSSQCAWPLSHGDFLYFMGFDHLWVSALTTFYDTEKTLSLDVRAMLVYGQRDMNVENCLLLYSLAKQQWLVHHQSLGASQLWFWMVYSTRHAFRPREQALNPVRKWLLLPKPLCHPIMAYITLLVIITGY